ncbi:MAG TPA: glutamate formimidoyltransferase [Bryobacteraceae bacterium]|nr:glutamate formimidoyltransferase [Bryobacteraceae bacterium]
MPTPLVECVPNFSEGRDHAKIDAIVEAIRSAGAAVLDRTADHDHHRSVITFAAAPEIAAEAAFRAVRQAVDSIDLRQHSGVHPRIGSADVVPFVPVSGITLEDCARLAERTGRRIWDELRVPVYLYEAAALRPEARNLAHVRRGHLAPDFGGPGRHHSSGAVAVGARKFLIAFNVNLNTADLAIARRIARTVRFSSGGLPYVKAVGLMLDSRKLVQVSMNLTDFEQTPIHVAFAAVRQEAERHGVAIAGTEVIGLVPQKALDMANAAGFHDENLSPEIVLENRLASHLAPKL